MARIVLAALLVGLLATQVPAAAEPANAGASSLPPATESAPWPEAPTDHLTSTVKEFLQALRGWAALLRFAAGNAKTVAELAQHAPGNMSMLINALPRADLTPIIAKPELKVTILAPTNAAFREALLKLKLTPKQLYADKTALTNILSYHVIANQALKVGDLKDGMELTTVSQQKIKVAVDKVAGTLFKGATETAKIVAPDLVAGQSVVHVIDTVLLPPPKPSRK